ncbi:unnamed protein product [Cercospora beticola]|nr:unnamed protein product [Cercospora beticola]
MFLRLFLLATFFGVIDAQCTGRSRSCSSDGRHVLICHEGWHGEIRETCSEYEGCYECPNYGPTCVYDPEFCPKIPDFPGDNA